MKDVVKVDAQTLLVGDTLMLKNDNKVVYGSIKEVRKSTPKKSFILLENVVYENGKQEPSLYAIIDNNELYHSSTINESAEVLDGTEPFSNGIFLVNVPDEEILKRNKAVDDYSEKILAEAKKLVDEPIPISKTDNESTEDGDASDQKLKSNFKSITITKK